MRKKILNEIVKKILLTIPIKNLETVKDFINELPQAKITMKTPKKFQINEFVISFYQYLDIIINKKLLEIWINYPNEPSGYVRLDPDWKEGLKKKNTSRKLYGFISVQNFVVKVFLVYYVKLVSNWQKLIKHIQLLPILGMWRC